MPVSRLHAGGRPAVTVSLVTSACLASPLVSRRVSDFNLSLATDALQAMAAALLLGAAMLWFARWRLTCEVRTASTAVALCLVAALVFPLDLAAGMVFDDAQWQQENPVSWTVVTPMVFVLLGRALCSTEVNSRFRPLLLLCALGGTTVLSFIASAAAHQVLGITFDPPQGRVQVAEWVAGGLWVLLAVGHAVEGWRQRSATQQWTAVALALLGLSCAYRGLAVGGSFDWFFSAALVVTAAAGTALWSSMADLIEVYAHEGNRYVTVTSVLAEAEQVITDEHERRQEMVHEARSAIASVRAASHNISGYGDGLGGDLRAELARGLYAELARLEGLIDLPVHAASEVFDVAGCLGPVLSTYRADGLRIEALLEPLSVRGCRDDLVAVVTNLLTNARRYAPGSVVDVWTERADEDVLLFVADRGPGIPLREQEAIFKRGARGQAAAGVAGSGLGLYTSRRLMEAHGGRLDARERLRGGALFSVTLPAAPSASGAAEVSAASAAPPWSGGSAAGGWYRSDARP